MRNFHVFADGIDVERNKIEKVSDNLGQSHCHDKYEILYVIEGQGKCVIEGVEYQIKPRCVFVFAPLVYRALYLEEGSVYDRASITFRKEHVSSSVTEILTAFGNDDSKLSPAVFYAADTVSDQIASVVERFESAEGFPEAEKAKFMGLLISELVLLISMAGGEAGGYDESELGARVIRYLNENGERDISLDRLARRFFVSKYHFLFAPKLFALL